HHGADRPVDLGQHQPVRKSLRLAHGVVPFSLSALISLAEHPISRRIASVSCDGAGGAWRIALSIPDMLIAGATTVGFASAGSRAARPRCCTCGSAKTSLIA